MHRRQKSRAPIRHAAGRQAAWVGQHNERGQVLALTAKPIRDPRSHRWKSRSNVAAVHHEHRWSVQSGFVLHGVDECHIVHVLCKLGKQVAHPFPALSMLAEGPEALGIVSSDTSKRLFPQLSIEGLTVEFLQRGFVIPRIDMAHAARAEDLNDGLGFGRNRRGFRGQRIVHGCRMQTLARQQRSQCCTAEVRQEVAS